MRTRRRWKRSFRRARKHRAVFLDALAAAPDVFVGTGALAHRDDIATRFPRAAIANDTRAYPSTAYLASIGHLLPPFTHDAVRGLEPVYLRPSGAERKRLRSHAPEKAGDDA